MTEFDRRTYLKTAGIVAAGTVGLAGCSGTASATGTLATQVTDQPGDIADFESCVVTMQGLWIKSAEGDDATAQEGTITDSETIVEQEEGDIDESDGREYHEFDDPQEADLVELQNGNTDLIDERELDVGTYEFLQLDVTGVEGVLAEGDEAEVDTPGGAPLQFKHPFEIREEEVTTFTGDFTPVRRGQTERYLLQPVAQGTEVTYRDEADDAE
jgi:hypothetical protein